MHSRSCLRWQAVPDLSAPLLGRKMQRGLLSYLHLWHNGCTACRRMQTNLFLPVQVISLFSGASGAAGGAAGDGGEGCFVDRYLQAGAWEFLAEEVKACADLSQGRAATWPPFTKTLSCGFKDSLVCMCIFIFIFFYEARHWVRSKNPPSQVLCNPPTPTAD